MSRLQLGDPIDAVLVILVIGILIATLFQYMEVETGVPLACGLSILGVLYRRLYQTKSHN